MRSMKKMLKMVFVAVLCVAMALSDIGGGMDTACATVKRQPLNVNFCGTTVKLVNDLFGDFSEWKPVKMKTVEKKWGKPNKIEWLVKNEEGRYIWKKGKTTISLNNYSGKAPGDVGGIDIEMKDTNGSIYGVKVGMKKEKALKKLRKAVGKDRVIVLKEGQQPYGDVQEGSMINFTGSTGEAASNNEIIYVTAGPYMPMQFDLTKNGKVKRIYYFNS